MKQKHLFSLLDTSYTTIGVIYDRVAPPAPPAPAKRNARGEWINDRGERVTDRAPPWGDAARDDGQQVYTFKAPKDADVQVDDMVIVLNGRELKVVRVVRVDGAPQIDIDADFDYRWIVQKVDRSDYDKRVEHERTFADAMLEIERTRQRELMVQGFKDTLPEGSEARKLFDRTMGAIAAPAVEHEAAPTPNVTGAEEPK